MDAPASSVALSPVGEYLVTTHVDEQGIYLWWGKGCLCVHVEGMGCRAYTDAHWWCMLLSTSV